MTNLLIAGCGDIGQRIAQLARTQGHHVTGIVRSHESAARLTEQGITALQTDLAAPQVLPPAEQLYYCAAPPKTGHTDPTLKAFLHALANPPQRIVYISTSGVYGNCNGAWIDENQPLNPESDRAHRRVDAETTLAHWCTDRQVEYVILRVPGIYGPGRLPRARLQKKLPVVHAAESPFTNRIHADDLAGLCIAAMQHGTSTHAYNVSDGNPTTMADYFTRCAQLLDLPAPPQVSFAEAQQQFTPAMLSFLRESKRLKTHKMQAELHYTLRYPTLSAGLPACV